MDAALGAELVKRRQRATRGDFEDHPRSPVEIPICALDQRRGWVPAVRATFALCGWGAKTVYRRQHSAESDFEDRPRMPRPAIERCPIEVAIGGLHQRCRRLIAVRATGAPLGAEAVQRRERAARSDFENRPTAWECGAARPAA